MCSTTKKKSSRSQQKITKKMRAAVADGVMTVTDSKLHRFWASQKVYVNYKILCCWEFCLHLFCLGKIKSKKKMLFKVPYNESLVLHLWVLCPALLWWIVCGRWLGTCLVVYGSFNGQNKKKISTSPSPFYSSTSTYSAEPMRPNSSAPQLPKMMDLRGLQLPARGMQR